MRFITRVVTGMVIGSALCFAQAWANPGFTADQVEALLDTTLHGWRFHMEPVEGAASPGFDDSGWSYVDVGHRWVPANSTCWFRKTITIPERIHGLPVAGKTVRLRAGMDNECEAWVGGAIAQEFKWGEGDVVLVKNATPGQAVTVALRGINGPGFGHFLDAHLVCEEDLALTQPLRALWEDIQLIRSDEVEIPAIEIALWRSRIDAALAALDAGAYARGDAAAFDASIAVARGVLTSDVATFEGSLARTASALAQLKVRIAEGRERGLQLAYPGVNARVVESFVQYARDDLGEGAFRRTIRALKIARYLEHIVAEGRAETEAILADPALDRKVPQYKTGPVEIRDGAFWQSGQPLFFTGVGHFGQAQQDISILNDYGLNTIQMEIGPNRVLTGPGVIDTAPITNGVLVQLDRAAGHNVAVDLLISPHYFPAWKLQEDPTLGECGMGFIKHCIEAPESREIMETFLRTLMPPIKDHPGLRSVCLSNEPQYTCKCRRSAARFRVWLSEKHGSLEALNEIWGTNHASFDDINIPENASHFPSHYDWCVFNQERFLEFHEFMRDIIHEYDPDMPVHAKNQSHAHFDHVTFEAGRDFEAFNGLGDITGNDCVQYYAGEKRGDFVQEWFDMAFNYTLQHCTRPGYPICNSEDHIIVDGEQRYIPSAHIRNVYFTQAIHGQGAATTWVWERAQGGDFEGNILTRPNCVLAQGRMALDLNRLGPEIHALQQARTDIAIFYSHASLAPDATHSSELQAAFEGAYFTDGVVDLVTERQAVAGKLAGYKVVVVPGAAHASDEVFQSFQQYLEGGGTVVAVGECFVRDPYARPREARLVSGGMGRVVDYPGTLGSHAYRDIIRGLMDETGCERLIQLSGVHGEPVWGVAVRAVRYEDSILLSLVNLNREAETVMPLVNGPADHAVNLFTGGTERFPITVSPLEPVLLRVSGQ